jgi:hypothetical protein
MGIPQIIVITLSALNALATAYLHGKPREGKYNIFAFLISSTLTYLILIAGGFFN